MDPAFGGQELFDSLSQASSGASRNRAARAESMTMGRSRAGGIGRHFTSNNNRAVNDNRRVHGGSTTGSLGETTISSLGNNSRLEDVYRMVGQSLSLQVTNGEDHRLRKPRPRARIGMQRGSCFLALSPGERPNHPPLQQGGPSPKVARLQRHQSSQDKDRAGTNGNSRNALSESPLVQQQRILKKLTTQRKESFQKWRLRKMQTASVTPVGNNTSSSYYGHRYTTSSGTLSNGSSRLHHQSTRNKNAMPYDTHETSPQRHAFSKMGLKPNNNAVSGSPQKHPHDRLHDIDEQQQIAQVDEHREPHQPAHAKASASTSSKGLLGSVIEGGAPAAGACGSESTLESESVHSLPSMQSSQAISKASARMVAANLATCQDGVMQYYSPRGQCLTNPSEPAGNDGFDNADGNLILHQNDILLIPKCKRLASSKPSPVISTAAGMELRIESMLGQGTFAQVFCCYDPALRKHVALKIVKNKPAYTKQAMVEIEVFHALADSQEKEKLKEKSAGTVGSGTGTTTGTTTTNTTEHPDGEPNYMVNLLSYFMYRSHLCLVFELLGSNLYEVLKRRQFLGLSLPMVRSVITQALSGICKLTQSAVVHCDLKPENILLISEDVTRKMVGSGRAPRRSASIPEKDENMDSQSLDSRKSKDDTVTSSQSKGYLANTRAAAGPQKIKLIDFGSACFEGHASHTYTQSRFYRSPEVLMGLPYDSAIDMWSLGCIAAELYLGVPILPGVHEHDQCGRICEMICNIPDWMLEQGQKSSKYFVKYVPRPSSTDVGKDVNTKQERPVLPQWRIKTQNEYISSLSQTEIRKKGGIEKLQEQPAYRYFKRKHLKDIIMLHGQSFVGEEKEVLVAFVHFLYGLLEPDPWKRWTGFQAIQHPFITGMFQQLRPKSDDISMDSRKENHANLELDHFWSAPLDPAICRRQLSNVQKMREKQESSRRTLNDAKRLPDTSTSSRNSRGGGHPFSSSNSVQSDFERSNLRHLHSQRGRNEALLSSSLSEVGLPGNQALLASEQPSRAGYSYDVTQLPSGAQSLTGVSLDLNRAQVGGDFGYALQRPGVIPDGTDATTIASYTSVNSQNSLGMMGAPPHALLQHRQQQPSDGNGLHSSTDQSFMHPRMVTTNQHGGLSTSHGHVGMTSASYTDYGNSEMTTSRSVGGYYDESQSRSVGGRFDGGRHRAQFSTEMNQNLGSYNERRVPTSQVSENGAAQYLSNSVGRDSSCIDQQSQMTSEYQQSLLYQQQIVALQVQHQQQLAALQAQHQQQLAGHGLPVHPPQMAYQQQHNFAGNTYGAAPGGYYYVPAADGTPVLMQTVGAVGAAYPAGGANSLPGQQQHMMQQQGFEQRSLNGQYGSNRNRDYS